MKILAFDTAVMGCSVAVMDTETGELHQDCVITERKQAEILVPMIEAVMQKARLEFQDIDRIVVTIGPGSFTGVRIGLATARALALSSQKPLIGITTLQVMASQPALNESKRVLALVDTKRNDFYGELYASDGTVLEPARIWSADEVASVREDTNISVIEGNPDIETLARLGVVAEISKALPDPVYLRGAEVSTSKRVAPIAI